MGERDVEAGAENDVILLFADWRIADVDVSKGVLPSESLVDFSDGAEIEGSAVFACVRHVRKEVKVLVKDGSLAEVVHELISQSKRGKVATEGEILFVCIVRTGQKIERGVLALDRMKAESTSEERPQVEGLQIIAEEISVYECEKA